MSSEALHEGVEVHMINGVPVKVFCLAKTVTDCFKYRNKIGLDVALHCRGAAGESYRAPRSTRNEPVLRFGAK